MTTTLDRPSDVDISLDIDLSLLVGPMDDIECEHSQHNTKHRAHSAGPATHYMKTIHACTPLRVYAACERFATMAEANQLQMICHTCQYIGYSGEFLEVVGRVGE